MKNFTNSPASLPAALQFPFELAAEGLVQVEEMIRAQAEAFDPGVQGYISYILNTSGKRIRPALSLLAGGACGESGEKQVKLGVIIELIHLATLVHDDIMDGAVIRRSEPTAVAKWGASLSVLLGDSLFAHALELASSFDSVHLSRLVARAAREVCQGEILQTQRRFDLGLSLNDYFRIIRMKTAALFSTAAELSCWLAGASEPVQKNLHRYGDLLGTAYQIYDDVLDLTGEEGRAGKTLGTDLAKGKLTLPVLYLMEAASETQRTQLNKLILSQQPIDISVLAGIAGYNGAISRAVKTAKGMLIEARESLMILPGNDHVVAMEAVTGYLDSLLDGCRPA